MGWGSAKYMNVWEPDAASAAQDAAAIERSLVPALHIDAAVAAKDQGAKPVPLRLIQVVADRQLFRKLRQHRFHRWFQGPCQCHASFAAMPCDDRAGMHAIATAGVFDRQAAAHL